MNTRKSSNLATRVTKQTVSSRRDVEKAPLDTGGAKRSDIMKIVVQDLARIHKRSRIDIVELMALEITDDATGYRHRLALVLAPSVPPFLDKPLVVVTGVDKGSGRSGSELNFNLRFKDLKRLSSSLTEVLHKLHGDQDR